MNLNKGKNDSRFILSKICKDYLMFLAIDPISAKWVFKKLSLIFFSSLKNRSFNSSTIGLNASFESNPNYPQKEDNIDKVDVTKKTV
ncbi:hypothetical protein BpHYR1_029016 [Brachionus plicatilis]|uniref:Uncharacterized protein n=1 Tax=Brachionus plicatilis TaxID=10195 RepID=A0A3M7SWI8_BRAPC|nr:hypothetical protein BpHYR1_029016 [Brachionus plicatilis]